MESNETPPAPKANEKTSEKKETIRLNVLLQEHGVASRRKADDLIRSGAVRIDGKVVTTLGIQVEKKSAILVNGKPLQKAPGKAVYLFHKPPLTMTTRKDEQERPTIFSLPMLKNLPANVQAVGRLDFRSEGLLLLTNDGDLALALSHPKYSVEKTYAVLVSASITIEEIEKLRNGIQLEDGLAKPIAVKQGNKERLGSTSGQWVEIVVTEGRNRLVRRMLEALGLKVMRLVRVGIGDLRLPVNLPAGKIRLATDVEKTYLKEIKKNLTQETNRLKRQKAKALANETGMAKPPAKRRKKRKSMSDFTYRQKTIKRQKKTAKVAKERKAQKAVAQAAYDRKPKSRTLDSESTRPGAESSRKRTKPQRPRAESSRSRKKA